MAKDNENLFAAATGRRQAEQEALKRSLTQDAAVDADQADAEPADSKSSGKFRVEHPRAKLTLALSNSDKIKLKTIAVNRGVTVAQLVHEWIETLE